MTRREALRLAGAGVAAAVGASSLLNLGARSGATTLAGTKTRSGSTAMTKVTDQLGWLKTSQWAGSYAAIANGYYAAQGIDEDLLAGGPNIVASEVVGTGHALIGQDDNATALEYIAKGVPNVIYATIYQRTPYSVFSYPDKPIRDLQGFEGKTIACSPSTIPSIDPLLKKAGVPISSVKFVNAVDLTQFIDHQVDGYFGFITQEGEVLKDDHINFIWVSEWDLGLKSLGNVFITQRSTLEKQKDLLIRHLRATIQGWEYAITYPKQMGTLTVDKFAPPGDNLEAETNQAIAQVALIKNPSGVMRFTESQMNQVLQSLIQSKSLAKPVTFAEAATTEILDAVYGAKTSIPF
jgi:NitT/TauT family transport system substrate-binding protein